MSELDPVLILDSLANRCERGSARAFWVLSSAAAHLRGNHDRARSSTFTFFYPDAPAETREQLTRLAGGGQ